MSLSSDWTNALAANGITTAFMMRFDFESGPVFIWTGQFAFPVSGATDTLLNGNTFEPLIDGVVLSVGENAFSYQGSEALEIKLGVSDPLPDPLALASVTKSEYQARRFVMWRAVMLTPPGLINPATWIYERVRYGSMDEISITRGGGQAIFSITIQSHAARISVASQALWQQQSLLDPNDLSQKYVSSSLDGHPGEPAPPLSPRDAAIARLRGLFD